MRHLNATVRNKPEAVATLAANLRSARIRAELSQPEVARRLGMSRSAISEMERSVRMVLAVELAALAEVYGVTMQCLTGSEPGLKPLPTSDLSDAVGNLATILRNDSRDWSATKRDMWTYGVLVGWGCEQDHPHDWVCGGDDRLGHLADRHRLHGTEVRTLQRHRAAVRALLEPAGTTRTGGEPARNDPGSSEPEHEPEHPAEEVTPMHGTDGEGSGGVDGGSNS